MPVAAGAEGKAGNAAPDLRFPRIGSQSSTSASASASEALPAGGALPLPFRLLLGLARAGGGELDAARSAGVAAGPGAAAAAAFGWLLADWAEGVRDRKMLDAVSLRSPSDRRLKAPRVGTAAEAVLAGFVCTGVCSAYTHGVWQVGKWAGVRVRVVMLRASERAGGAGINPPSPPGTRRLAGMGPYCAPSTPTAGRCCCCCTATAQRVCVCVCVRRGGGQAGDGARVGASASGSAAGSGVARARPGSAGLRHLPADKSPQTSAQRPL